MADINSTLAVSIKDDTEGYDCIVDSDGDLNTKSKIWDGTTEVEVFTGQDGAKRLRTESLQQKFPKGFDSLASYTVDVPISTKGGYNTKAFRPGIITEGAPTGTDVVVTGSSSAVKHLQIFRASENNISEMIGSIVSTSVETELDDFDGDVESTWTSTDNGDFERKQETGIKYEGTGSMRLKVKDDKADTVYKTFSQDLSTTTTIELYLYGTKTTVTQLWLELEDSSGYRKRSLNFGSSILNTWQLKQLDLSKFIEQQVSSTDLTDIVKISFGYDTATYVKDAQWYVDLLTADVANEATATVKVYDFGTNSNPTSLSDGTLLTWDDGVSTSVTATLVSSIRQPIEVDVSIGVSDPTKELTKGNYYGIYFETTEADVYGSNTQTYQNGKLYSIDGSDNLTDETATIYFGVYAIPDSYSIELVHVAFDSAPEGGEMYLTVLDDNNSVKDTVIMDWKLWANTIGTFNFDDLTVYDKEDTLRWLLSDDYSSDLKHMALTINYSHKAIVRYG